jgi:hypothetical protein
MRPYLEKTHHQKKALVEWLSGSKCSKPSTAERKEGGKEEGRKGNNVK